MCKYAIKSHNFMPWAVHRHVFLMNFIKKQEKQQMQRRHRQGVRTRLRALCLRCSENQGVLPGDLASLGGPASGPPAPLSQMSPVSSQAHPQGSGFTIKVPSVPLSFPPPSLIIVPTSLPTRDQFLWGRSSPTLPVSDFCSVPSQATHQMSHRRPKLNQNLSVHIHRCR